MLEDPTTEPALMVRARVLGHEDRNGRRLYRVDIRLDACLNGYHGDRLEVPVPDDADAAVITQTILRCVEHRVRTQTHLGDHAAHRLSIEVEHG